MVYKVSKFIDTHQLFDVNSKLLLAVSGGVDSIVLLHLLHSLQYNCVVAHCNFHLRGEESDSDADFVKKTAEFLGLKFLKIDFETQKFASKEKISIEMAARNLRYDWFEKVRQQEGCDCIVVAHHNDDSIETFFLNLVRGTGIKGLSGIAPKNGFVVRPLLECSREEIINYAKNHSLSYCVDSTNKDNSYRRNFIRNKIMLLFDELNPSFRSMMLENMKRIANASDFIFNYISSYCNDLIISVDDETRISIDILQKQPSPSLVLYELLTPFGFNSRVIEQIFQHLSSESGKRFFSSSHQLIKDRSYLIVAPIKSTDEEIFLINEGDSVVESPLKITIKKGLVADCLIQKTNCVATLDLQKLSFPLKLRRWKNGDWFVPFGMKGRKKLSDFFADKKYSLLDKENCWLLVDSKDTIVWVVGERTDNRFRITEQTTFYYQLELKK